MEVFGVAIVEVGAAGGGGEVKVGRGESTTESEPDWPADDTDEEGKVSG